MTSWNYGIMKIDWRLIDLTLEERLAIIEQKANNNKVKTKENETDLRIKTQEALSKVKDLTPRINAIITVANKCIDEGIDFPSESVTAKFGYGTGYRSYNFLADGINHHVGFMNCGRRYWREGEKQANSDAIYPRAGSNRFRHFAFFC